MKNAHHECFTWKLLRNLHEIVDWNRISWTFFMKIRKKRNWVFFGFYSIRIAGLNGSAIRAFWWVLSSEFTIFTGRLYSLSINSFVDSKTAFSSIPDSTILVTSLGGSLWIKFVICFLFLVLVLNACVWTLEIMMFTRPVFPMSFRLVGISLTLREIYGTQKKLSHS